MKVYYPDYYNDFSCLAGDCRHSCCRGWEIDIDAESLRRFRRVSGKLGKDLRAAISTKDTPHFILREDERCPFLRDDGLCRLIVELGGDSLCDICAEHPRFYNDYSETLDAGLGACCEAVAHLIVSGATPTAYLISEEGESPELPLLSLREQIFDILAGSSGLSERMETCLALLGSALPAFDLQREAEFYLTLERMDDEWTALLESLCAAAPAPLEPRLSDLRFERIAEYFVYRHFAAAESEQEAALRLQFAFLSTMLVCAAGGDTENILRLYSAEIEYSDENIARILDRLARLSNASPSPASGDAIYR